MIHPNLFDKVGILGHDLTFSNLPNRVNSSHCGEKNFKEYTIIAMSHKIGSIKGSKKITNSASWLNISTKKDIMKYES